MDFTQSVPCTRCQHHASAVRLQTHQLSCICRQRYYSQRRAARSQLCQEQQHSVDDQVRPQERYQAQTDHCRNTGHDFLGRNTGGGALQVWVHRMKAFEYLPTYKVGQYNDQAARVGAALEQHEVYDAMSTHGITLLAPGSPTVGAYGGYMQGGGFSYITSKYGLMADQVLALELVTADGRFVHADPMENADLFFAIRGGGPGKLPTYLYNYLRY